MAGEEEAGEEVVEGLAGYLVVVGFGFWFGGGGGGEGGEDV